MHFAKASASALWKKLMPLLEDHDAEIVRHTLELLTRIPDSPSSNAHWKKLLKSKAPAVRTAAARQLCEGESIETARFLVSLLGAEEAEIREIAAGALARHKKAPGLLLAELANSKEPEHAWRLAKILKPHAESTDKATVRKFTTLAAKDMLSGNPRHEAILYFLRHAAPGVNDEVLLEVGTELRKGKKWEQAVDCLRKLIHTPLFTNDVAYDLSVANLKLSHKDLSAAVREKDYALRGFQSLLRRGSDELISRLSKDRSLDASDIYYVGFHFSESMGPDRDFGEQLMKMLIKKWPKSAEAKSARKKLGISRTSSVKTGSRSSPPRKKAVKKTPARTDQSKKRKSSK